MAMADLNRAIELEPDQAGAFHHRGWLHWQEGDRERGFADLTRAIELGTADADAYFDRGAAFAEQDEMKLAVRDFALILDGIELYGAVRRGRYRLQEAAR